MVKYWCYFLFLLWFSYSILSSILLFTEGFLLSRVTQKINSTCRILPTPCTFNKSTTTNENEYYCESNNEESVLNYINSASNVCLPQKAKVVLIIIDALRYDFAAYNAELQETIFPYQNKLLVINQLLKLHPLSTRLYKFIADPPTTTMQRLNALTTGSLPTFIDAGSNFATAEINEDNLIDQLVKHNHDIVFMGDDTWIGLYPNRFTRSYPFPSFNVHDLDTVDYGVIKHLYPELKQNDFSLLIAHFLGVDHCGHRYGPYHAEMGRKLTEMNDVIENVVNEMDNSTILIVIGDHGMTETGDHGGSSDNEITSAMFVYSKQPLKKLETTNIIKQVDLVPTISAILGVPAPFSNLGTVILDSIPIVNETEWKTLLFHLWANIQQIVNYIKEYSKTTTTFNSEEVEELHEKYHILNARIHSVKNEDDFRKFLADGKRFMISLRQLCEAVWIQFDPFFMSRGLLLLFMTTFFVYIIVDGIPSERLPEIFMSSFLVCSYTALLIAVGISCVLYYFSFVDRLLLNIYFSTGVMSLFMLAMLIVQNWEVISMHWYERSKKSRFPNLIIRLILIFSICGVFSNSYIVEEANVLLFLLVTIIFFNIYGVTTNTNYKGKVVNFDSFKLKVFLGTFLICLLARLSMYFWRCREEQQWCLLFDTFISNKSGASTSRIEWTLTLLSLALLVTVTRIWLRSSGNLIGHSPTVILAQYAPTVIVVCTGGFWVLHRLPKDTKTKLFHHWQPDILAWVSYLLFTLGTASVVLQPLCVYIIPKQTNIPVGNTSQTVPLLFQKIKGLFNSKGPENDDVPVVCGLATVYSAAYIVIGIYFCLLWALLLGDAIAPAAAITFLTTILVIITVSLARIQKVSEIEQLLEVPGSLILAMVLLSHYFFYATGHQPTFPSIAWEAAFVGTAPVFKYNFIPATLIIINTFGSYIIIGLLLPLLIIAPFTVFIMMPSIVPRKGDNQKDRGEILLYEKSGKLLKAVFVLCCKYIMCHAIKVFATMLSSTIHCRHLMVWKIFAPKLIFECIGTLVSLGSVLAGYLLLIQIHRKVNGLVYCLNKQYR